MQHRKLGHSGLLVAPLALGTFNFGRATPEAEAARILDAALDAGVNLVDTADSYHGGDSERIIGRILARNKRRHDVILATKVHYPVAPRNAGGDARANTRGNSRLHLIRACEASLRRLQTDHIDLYQIHRPPLHTPVEETLRALDDLVHQGKVRYVGCSTHPAWQVMEALMVSGQRRLVRYVSEQPPYNLLDRRIENELLPLCQKHDVAILPWSPLAMGLLAGRYDHDHLPPGSRAAQIGGIYAERVTVRGIETGRRFSALARDAGLTPAQLALLWTKDQPGITAPIAGPRTLAQWQEVLPILDMSLSAELRAACDRLVPPGSAVVDFHNTAPWMKMRL
jgi:aryl-alcohol dehydrogenase-like predicted oxidoreductase